MGNESSAIEIVESNDGTLEVMSQVCSSSLLEYVINRGPSGKKATNRMLSLKGTMLEPSLIFHIWAVASLFHRLERQIEMIRVPSRENTGVSIHTLCCDSLNTAPVEVSQTKINLDVSPTTYASFEWSGEKIGNCAELP